jgi:hypothetical protein
MFMSTNVHVESGHDISGKISTGSVTGQQYGVLWIGELADSVTLYLGDNAGDAAAILRKLIAEANGMLETLKESQYVH